jgi:hypothetical protein
MYSLIKMKKILIILIACSAIACSKSNDADEVVTRQDIVGRWKLIEYYRDIGNGTGEWVPTDPNDIEIVEFQADGKFLHNENFSIQDGIDRYKIIEENKVALYSSAGNDTVVYFFKQDKRNELIFNPVCREFSCMKKHIRN